MRRRARNLAILAALAAGGWYHTTGSDASVTVQVKALAVGAKRLILSHALGTATRDTIGVRATDTAPPPATPFAIGLAPAAATLDTGATQQFAAVVDTMNHGRAKTFVGIRSATSGTVTSGGLYKAGASAGSDRAIATEGGKADTAVVMINLLPPPPPPPPQPPPPTTTSGCPTSGSLRLVSVSTDAQLASALSAALPGDQIRIAAGTYSGARSWSKSGTASAPITLCGLPGVGPVIKSGTFTGTGSYVIYTGIVFQGADAVESRNNVYLHDAHHVTFTGNEIRGGHYHAGLSVDEVHHMTITYNYIHDNGHDTSHDHGIYFKTTSGPGNFIANNLLVRNAARGISLHDNTGVGVFDVLVTHNTMAENGSTGLLVDDGDRITVANNIAAENGAATGQKQIRVIAGNNNRVYNNLTYSTTSSRAGIENTTSSTLSGNVVGNPLFLFGYGDLHLQAGSPALGLGLPAYVWGADYDGGPRDSAPDAGAYER